MHQAMSWPVCHVSRAHRYDLRQEVESFVNGRLSIKVVALRAELVMQDSLQALCQGTSLILQPGGLLMHGIGVLLQLLILPASASGIGETPKLWNEKYSCFLLQVHRFHTLLNSWCTYADYTS